MFGYGFQPGDWQPTLPRRCAYCDLHHGDYQVCENARAEALTLDDLERGPFCGRCKSNHTTSYSCDHVHRQRVNAGILADKAKEDARAWAFVAEIIDRDDAHRRLERVLRNLDTTERRKH